MHLDDDDLYDYSDSFNEDEAIEQVIKALKPGVSVDESIVEDELDKVDWDIDIAISNLRKRYAKPKPTPQKSDASNASDVKNKGKLTPLQLLALRRSQAHTVSSNNNTNEQSQKETSSTTPQNGLSSLAKLASLRRSSKLTSEDQGAKSSSDSGANIIEGNKPLTALEKLKMRKMNLSGNKNLSVNSSTASKDNAIGDTKYPSSNDKPENSSTEWSPDIDYNSFAKSASMATPSSFGALFGVHLYPIFKNKITNSFKVAKTAQSSFSKPSPDDVVLTAQEKAFGKSTSNAKDSTSKSGNLTAEDEKSGKKKNNSTVNNEKAVPKSKVQIAKPKSLLAPPAKDQVIKRMQALKLKDACSFVVIGHVDAGKSTLIGRLLYDNGSLDPKEVHKFEKESAKAGKPSFWLAWALDSTHEERMRGITVDIGEASFETKNSRFTVLDAPGHHEYIPNMIGGVTQADIAVLVVDSSTNAFESGFSLSGQTREHVILARSLGIETIVVAVNKLDTQDWSSDRYNDIMDQLNEFLIKKVGYKSDQISYVPTSGITGENVVKRGNDPKLSWYKGPTLLGVLENLSHSKEQHDSLSEPLRFLISSAHVVPYKNQWAVSGSVLSGCVDVNDHVQILGVDDTAVIKEMDPTFMVTGERGLLTIALDNLKVDENSAVIHPGDLIVGEGANIQPVSKFIAKVMLFDVERPVLVGSKLSFYLGNVDDTVKLNRIVEVISDKKPKTTRSRVMHLRKGAIARVELELSSPAILAPVDVCKKISRFILRSNGETIGGGVVESVEN